MTIFQTLVVARWAHFASLFAVFGSSFFWIFLGREWWTNSANGQARRATIILLRVAAPVAAISGIAWLAGILANMTGGFGNVLDLETLHAFLFETQFGWVAISRVGLLAAIVAIALVPLRNHAWLSAFLVVSAMLLIMQAWLGHAAEGGASLAGAMMITAYGVHMLAAGAWVGGLAPLLLVLAEQRRLNPGKARQGTLDILSCYSLMAIVAVTLIIASGLANTAFRVGASVGKLFDTAYGEVLLTKLGVIAVMLALAYFNRFVAMPRLRAALSADIAQITRLRTSVALELALGILVLGLAAVLGITPPPQ